MKDEDDGAYKSIPLILIPVSFVGLSLLVGFALKALRDYGVHFTFAPATLISFATAYAVFCTLIYRVTGRNPSNHLVIHAITIVLSVVWLILTYVFLWVTMVD